MNFRTIQIGSGVDTESSCVCVCVCVCGRTSFSAVEWLKSADGHTTSSYAADRNEWSYETTPLHAYTACNFSKNVIFFMAQQTLFGRCLLIIEASRLHSDTPRSVVLLRTRDQLVAETTTWQHTTLTTERHPCPIPHQRDSNPQPSKRTFEDPRLRKRSQPDRLSFCMKQLVNAWIESNI
jgi:hypothetical protein